jgi:hypothetical protein
MRIKRQPEKHLFTFIIMLFLHKIIYLYICICIYYTNAATPVEKLMEKLIKLVSDEQVKDNFTSNKKI